MNGSKKNEANQYVVSSFSSRLSLLLTGEPGGINSVSLSPSDALCILFLNPISSDADVDKILLSEVDSISGLGDS